MRIAIISCSLNPDSRSSEMAQALRRSLGDTQVDWIDLRECPLPMCDGGSVYGDPRVKQMEERIKAADAVILTVPIYNYDVNAAAKNLIELTGKPAWLNKVVGFVCSAGGRGSFMSVMSLANSLMLDFRCVIVPRFVYADDSDFIDGEISTLVLDRLETLGQETRRITAALSGVDALP